MWTLLACTAPDTPVDRERPVAWSEDPPEAVTPLEPAWSDADFVDAVAALGEVELPNPYLIAEVYTGLFVWGDETCPGLDDDLSPPEVPLYGCTAASGATFAGLSTFDQYASVVALSLGDFRITTPDGHDMTVAGNFFLDASFGTVLSFTGTWVDPAAEGWLGDGGSVFLELFDDGNTGLLVDGSIGGAQPLYMDDFSEACGGTGTLGLQGPEAGWYLAELDCGCGPLEFQGERLAEEVCVDTAGLVANLRGMVTEP